MGRKRITVANARIMGVLLQLAPALAMDKAHVRSKTNGAAFLLSVGRADDAATTLRELADTMGVWSARPATPEGEAWLEWAESVLA